MGINVEKLQDKTGQFSILPHRQIHLYKESPITYNPSAERTSDMTSTFYVCSLLSAAALWTWQITYWSADVVANVLLAWAAAAAACSMQPVLNPLGSPAESPASPHSALPHLPVSLSEAPPACWPPSSSLLVPPCPQKVWKASQTNAICSSRQKVAGEGSFGPCVLIPTTFDPLKPRSKEDSGKKTNTSSAHWQIKRGGRENGWKQR